MTYDQSSRIQHIRKCHKALYKVHKGIYIGRLLDYTRVTLHSYILVSSQCVAELTAITRVHRWRIVERPLDIEVSCEISRLKPDE